METIERHVDGGVDVGRKRRASRMVGVVRHTRPCAHRAADGKRISVLDIVDTVSNLPLRGSNQKEKCQYDGNALFVYASRLVTGEFMFHLVAYGLCYSVSLYCNRCV